MIVTGDSAELFKVVNVGQALDTMLGQLPRIKLETELCHLESALGRFLAQNVISPEALPPFARSTVDGFAVRARDTFGASEANPAYLSQVGEVLMGRRAETPVRSGEAVAIPTGGMLPEGADAVLMVEYSAMLDATTVEVVKAVGPGDNVIQAGEDIGQGEALLKAGRRLRAQDLGALAALGITQVQVYQPLKVGILSTGNEIVDAGEKPAAGQIRDVNYYALAGLVRQSGGEPVRLGICPDSAEELKSSLKAGLKQCQMVLISGGSSVGAADLTPKIIDELGQPGVLVHGIAVKPGKPTIMALIDDIPVFGLPGHSVSALDIYRLLADPLIKYIYSGREALERVEPQIKARLSRNLASVAGREDRVRVALKRRDGELWAEPILGKSGLISLTVRADGAAVIPFASEGIRQGEEITVELL